MTIRWHFRSLHTLVAVSLIAACAAVAIHVGPRVYRDLTADYYRFGNYVIKTWPGGSEVYEAVN